ncbi:acylphosphatase [Clostridium sp. JN-9]|uniref:acylphosphatase n=1 Tax=Clostridium sp. JN-9 TaxID=2507159 RepID=UPI000FFDFDF6|nr:acylphosphatase [Clostridium sp. JN-9]QAT41189.1 acylphosphatase [Clostridium sp. JN-9]
MKRYFIQVMGSVQGVGFRYFVSYTAKLYNITGWVRNCDDGSVEIEAQGHNEILDKFIKKLKIGNRFAEVENINITPLPLDDKESSFRVKY